MKDDVSEDLIKDAEDQVQTITNNYSNKVDERVALKEADIMKV